MKKRLRKKTEKKRTEDRLRRFLHDWMCPDLGVRYPPPIGTDEEIARVIGIDLARHGGELVTLVEVDRVNRTVDLIARFPRPAEYLIVGGEGV